MAKSNGSNTNENGKKGNSQVDRNIRKNTEIYHRQNTVPSRATSSEPSKPPKK